MRQNLKLRRKLTQLTWLDLEGNQLTNVKSLENLTGLTALSLFSNPDLTKAQIDELQKALPRAKSSATSVTTPPASDLEQAWREA